MRETETEKQSNKEIVCVRKKFNVFLLFTGTVCLTTAQGRVESYHEVNSDSGIKQVRIHFHVKLINRVSVILNILSAILF